MILFFFLEKNFISLVFIFSQQNFSLYISSSLISWYIEFFCYMLEYILSIYILDQCLKFSICKGQLVKLKKVNSQEKSTGNNLGMIAFEISPYHLLDVYPLKSVINELRYLI